MDRLDAYHFYERSWSDYDDLRETFEWQVPPEFNMAEYVCDRWADDPDRVAIYSEDGAGRTRTYTFRQLRRKTNRFANLLASNGVEAGDRVGVNLPQVPESIMAHIAAWKIGAVSVPLSTQFGEASLRYRLDDVGATVCVVSRENIEGLRAVADDVSSLSKVLLVGGAEPEQGELPLEDALADQPTALDPARVDPEDTAVVIYTSGTTGDPKGVRLPHRSLLGQLPGFVTTFCNMTLSDSDVFWTPTEWAWVGMYNMVLCPFFYGKPVFAYHGGKFDPKKAFELVSKYGITVFLLVPSGLRMMMDIEDPVETYDLDHVRVVPTGGESVDRQLVEWVADVFGGAQVQEAYGQTEANLLVGECTAFDTSSLDAMGRSTPGHDITIVDPETAEPTVETGEVGEIAVRYEGDPVCFDAYWNKPDLTDEKVQNGYLLTEDLGTRRADGYFTFEGRKDEVIITSGYRVSPEAVETKLEEHSRVEEAAVVGIPDEKRGRVPKAYVVLTESPLSQELHEKLQNRVKGELGRYEYPREIEAIEELPKTVSDKIDRNRLKQRE